MPHALDKMRYTREPTDLVEKELLNHCVCHKTSFLCAKLMEIDCALQICHRSVGWYLGTFGSEGEPLSRDSQYFGTEVEAQKALDNRQWEQRLDP